MRGEFRALTPDLDEKPYDEQRRLWRSYLKLPTPLMPSAEDLYRDASCLTCRDHGWITRWITENECRAFPCPNCSGWDERRKQYILDAMGIPEAKRCCNFQSWVPRPGTQEAADEAYALGTGTATYSLLLVYGGVGNGKTHLAYAAGLEAGERGLATRFVQLGALMSELRMAMQSGGSADSKVAELKRCDFLVLDDLGAEQGTDWQQSLIEELVNYRYAEEKPTLITTNKDPKSFSPALRSRFVDASISKMVFNQAGDYRPLKKSGR